MRIVIVGSGNIAHFFLPRLQQEGHEVVQIYSPNLENASKLAQLHGVDAYTNQLDKLIDDADVYILAVKDAALATLNESLRLQGKLVLHCAGAVSLNAISDISENRAVIWTLYSIRKNNLPDTNNIPLIVEANTDQGLEMTMLLAKAISGTVLQVNFEQRQLMHLNAVLVNNFTNHLFTIAEKLSEEHQLPFEILQPIIEQTFSRIGKVLPSESQTGPAIRKDEVTMHKHISLLESHPEWQQIYKDISLSIQTINK
jgi:pyrroline-5-carboxylate reductase